MVRASARWVGTSQLKRYELDLISRTMQAAFGLSEALPPAGPFVLALSHRLGAMRATDARIAAIVKRVVGHTVLNDIPPDFSPAPANQGIDLDAVPPAVPFNNLS